ncbi:MAG TPA: hypothetical protein VFO93_16085 [Hymenobacter sp.]|uniref:hypothetical protein n=1 Tax=Hymenobacter sp. TaxID=1898978 RepID=UPI002D7F1373|nr:hypothetical protein [Hymenobacter sp.]HET9505063.1 hypothetical protein [Hymenobacter sp.]
MNTKLLLLAAAATLATASCSEKKTETTETTTAPTGEQVTTTTTTTIDTTAYRTSAKTLADQVANDLAATDAAVKTRLENVYYTRGRALRDLDTRYATDTTGRYAALRAVNDQTTSEVKTIVTPAQYGTYTTGQGAYYNGPYTAVAATAAAAPAKRSLGARVGQGSGIKKLENDDDDSKVKYNNGAKIKRSDDGSVKIKRADGTKIKIDEHGNRTVKKGLF